MRDGEWIEDRWQAGRRRYHRTGKTGRLGNFRQEPLDEIHNTNTIRWVVKNEEVFEGDTLNQVWPEQKKLEPLYFWNHYDEPKSGDALSYGKTATPWRNDQRPVKN